VTSEEKPQDAFQALLEGQVGRDEVMLTFMEKLIQVSRSYSNPYK